MKTTNRNDYKPCRIRHDTAQARERDRNRTLTREIDDCLRQSAATAYSGISHYWRVHK